MKIKTVIYTIENIKNGKIYVGSSIKYKKRKCAHISTLKNGNHINKHLQNSFNKYGEESFVFKEIDFVIGTREDGFELEQYYIDKFYNKKVGLYNFSRLAKVGVRKVDYLVDVYDDYGNLIETDEALNIIKKYNLKTKELRRKVVKKVSHINGFLYRIHGSNPKDEGVCNFSNREFIYYLDPFGKILDTFYSIREANKKLKISDGLISKILNTNSRMRNDCYFKRVVDYDAKKDLLDNNRYNLIKGFANKTMTSNNKYIVFQIFDLKGRFFKNIYGNLKEFSKQTGLKKGANTFFQNNKFVEEVSRTTIILDKYFVRITTDNDLVDSISVKDDYMYDIYEDDKYVFSTKSVIECLRFVGLSYDIFYKRISVSTTILNNKNNRKIICINPDLNSRIRSNKNGL